MAFRKMAVAAAGVAALALGAPAWAQDGSRNVLPPPAEKATMARDDVNFMQEARRHSLAEIQLGHLAQERGMREQVKDFGARMVRDHGKANEELTRIAAAKGLQLPTHPEEHHREKMDELRKLVGPEFDREYMRMMVEAHEKDVKKFEKRAESAKDPDVKAFAQRQAPVLESHLNAARGTFDIAMASKRTGDRETGSRKP